MKTVCLCLLLLACFRALHADEIVFANDIPLTGTGMRFFLTDDEERPNENGPSDKEISADRTLLFGFRNVSTNGWNRILYLGFSNSFSFHLSDTNGNPIRFTALGREMNAGPLSKTNPDHAAARVRRTGPGARYFPNKLTELFNFPSNGVYVLEVRYWNWHPVAREFVRSPPVRVQVVKEPEH